MPSSPRHTAITIDIPAVAGRHRSGSSVMSSPDALSPSRAIGPVRGMGGRRAEEEEARKRQMTQDLDSAMSMSRARSSSIVPEQSPNLRPTRPSAQRFHSSSPIEEDDLGMSRYEQDAIHAAQYGDHHDDMSEIDHPAYRPDEHHDHLLDEPNLAHSHRGESLASSPFDQHTRLLCRRSDEDRHNGHGHAHDDRQRHEVERRLGLTGGVHAQNNNFDFGEMEQFAAVERDKLGLNNGFDVGPAAIPISPAEQGRLSAEQQAGSWGTDNLPRTNTFSAFGDDDAAHVTSPREGQTFARRRQRKLSQSNPVQRRGGKLALFEGFGNTPGAEGAEDGVVVKAPRLPKNALPIGPTGGGIMPYSDNAPGHDRPYRFSFYSNALPVTIHARTLAELPGEGQSFEDLFKGKNSAAAQQNGTGESVTLGGTETPREDGAGAKASMLARAAGAASRAGVAVPPSMQSTPGVGPPPGMADLSPAEEDSEVFTWWMDVLSPTDEEMRMLSKVFGIHPLTTEDILLEETREKIELFRNYYLVCFRSFDQDPYSQTYLEPLNMYIIVFREGTLSFHFRGTPHPQNVRRRIKHLKDYISVTSDWISYALIDDITDAFGPLIQSIEYEVDSIDELVLILKDSEQSDMLRRIGTCRKKVMGLLRLMGNKADVVKGLAKRCNEQWLVAPKSDIGLYLSDIQDHLITMTQNLNHYEKILSRSHSNYLAQISIEMTDANNQINDVLSKLTALGTVLIPMNLVTGLWGMNVHVPGQDIEEGYAWFGGILGCLMAFAVLGAFATYKCFVVR